MNFPQLVIIVGQKSKSQKSKKLRESLGRSKTLGIKQLDSFFLFLFSFSALKGPSRGELARRINAVVRRAIAGVFRAVDSVHCRNERVSLVGGRDNGCGDEVDEERVREREREREGEEERATRRTRVAIIARFITPVRFVCSAEKKPERERKKEAAGEFLQELEEKRFVSFFPFFVPFFPRSFFHSFTFSVSSNRRRRFLARPAESLTIRAEETVRTSSISELYNA